MSPIGLGFAGLGWLGESLVKELPNFPGFRLVGVQDARLELARDVSAHHGGVWFGERFEDLVGLPDVDAVAICTPNALHVPQATLALQARKHVLVQKPLALSAAEARAVVELAHGAGRILFVDYSYRFLATVEALRAALAQLGPVRAVSAEFHNIYGPGAEKTWFFDRALSGGGALVDLGVHLLDLGLWLLQPREVRLEDANLVRGTIERRAALRVRLDKDVPFDVAVSWNAPLPRSRIGLQIEGARGRLCWENVDGSFFRFRTRLDQTILIDRETTLRSDTLRALALALQTGSAPAVDTRVYTLLDEAYSTA